MNSEYLIILEENLRSIDEELLAFDDRENMAYESYYASIENYAFDKGLINTLISLKLLRGLCASNNLKAHLFKHNYINRLSQYWHAMEVAHMLIDLHLKLDRKEEDVLLSVSLLHVLDKLDMRTELKDIIEQKCCLNSEIFSILHMCKHPRYQTSADREIYYFNIQNNYLALLFKLADRGCFMSRLYELPAGRAKEYVVDTKNYFLPMCIYGKENYDELNGVISILMEKLRCLVDVAEIITNKYDQIHQNLNNEIIRYLEENSRLRMEIKTLKEESK